MDVMSPGLRTYKQSSLRVAMPQFADLGGNVREIIDVQSAVQGSGHASQLMRSVCLEADRAAKVLVLMPRKFADGLDNGALVMWYQKFGFLIIQVDPCMMARQPRQ
jgi:hypothetical protein